MSKKDAFKIAVSTMEKLAHEVGKEQFSKLRFKGNFLLITQFWINCGATALIDTNRAPDHVIELEGTLGWNLMSERDLLTNFFRTCLTSGSILGPLAEKIGEIEKAKCFSGNLITCGFMFDLQLDSNLNC
jgi:hypothetical protein